MLRGGSFIGDSSPVAGPLHLAKGFGALLVKYARRLIVLRH